VKTDELIGSLAAGLEPLTPGAMFLRLLAAAGMGAAVTFGIVALGYGLRTDLASAIEGWDFWRKLSFTAAVAMLGLWVVLHASRPGRRLAPKLALLALPFLLIFVMAGVELAHLPSAEARTAAWLGQSWAVCPWNIIALALPPALLLLRSVRHFAPTRPAVAGLAVGLASGGLAATFYGLHCPEGSASFIATWYALGLAGCGVVGALAGRRFLRW
jgi:hypothetical protein